MRTQYTVHIKQQSFYQHINTSEEEFLTATANGGVINMWNDETSEQLKID